MPGVYRALVDHCGSERRDLPLFEDIRVRRRLGRCPSVPEQGVAFGRFGNDSNGYD